MTNRVKYLIPAIIALMMAALVSCGKEEGEIVLEDNVEKTVFPKTRLSLTESEMSNIAPSNDYTFRFFRDNYQAETDMLLSPLGYQQTLAMVCNVVKNGEALRENLGFKGESMEGVNTYFQHLIQALSGEAFSNELSLANAFMTDVRAEKYPDSFINILKSNYFVDYHEIEAKPLSEQPIGSRPEDIWCQDNTDGMIQTAPFVIKKYETSLFNAFLFKGEWQDKFEKDQTPGEFFSKPERSVRTPFMRKDGKVNLYRCEDFSAVSLPFGDGTFDLSIILPTVRYNVGGVLEKLDSKAWESLRGEFVRKEVRMVIPVFSTSYSKWQTLDYEFIGGIAPFKLIGQKATFAMNEDGASAASVTQAHVAMADLSSIVRKETFIADSPFIYTITESGSGLILFIGVYSGADKEEMIQS